MDWIHCNKCFLQPEPGTTLHLTSCGHLCCNKCLNNGVTESTCVICRVPCSYMKLAPGMNSEIQDYFTEPEDIIKKSCEVLQFQRQHRRRLLSYLMQSTRKFYAVRTELRRMTEICQKQHKKLKDYQKIINTYEAEFKNNQMNQTRLSPYNMAVSPSSDHVNSPTSLLYTPTIKRPAQSTPNSQSALLTPARMTKQRSTNFSDDRQKSNSSNKISSTVNSPDTPQSAGSRGSQRISPDSGYASNSPLSLSPGFIYCSGLETKCNFKKKIFTSQRYI